MRILIISYGYSPQLNPRAFRWTALAESWAKTHDAEIDVITALNQDRPASELVNGVHVHRVGMKTERWLRNRSGSQGPSTNHLTLTNYVLRFLKWVYRRTWQKLLWPDYACLWYFPALRKARELCAKNRYDYLISVSHPFTGHLVGLSLNKQLKTLPWMVDIGDPFAFLEGVPPNNRALYNRLNYFIERRILQKATVVSVTTSETLELYKHKLAVAADKIHVLPPLVDLSAFSTRSAVKTELGINIIYLGTLYRQIRSPEPLLKLFRRLLETYPDDQYRLHFYGSVNDCESFFASVAPLIGQSVFRHGLVPRSIAQSALEASDVVINLGNETLFQLPSKTVECVAAGKPILNLTQTSNDSSVKFFADYPSIFNITLDDIDRDPGVIERLHQFLQHAQPVDRNWIEPRIRRYSLPEVSAAYWELLQ